MAEADDSPTSTPIGNDPTEPNPDAEMHPAGEPSTSDAPSPRLDEPASSEIHAPAGLGGLLLTALAVLVCGLGIAFVIERYLAPGRDPGGKVGVVASTSNSNSRANHATEPSPPTAKTSAPPLNRTLAVHELAERLDKLVDQVAVLQKQVDAQTRSGPPPEIASLQVRLADLTTLTNNLAPLPSKVDGLDHRLADLAAEIQSLRAEASANHPQPSVSNRVDPAILTPRDPATTPTALPDARRTTPARPPTSLADPRALAAVADLYRRGKYKEAREALNPLMTKSPGDARVWYYAALCTGFSTKDWTAAAAQLVRKGIAREEAGTPRAPEIDAEFKDLTTPTGKDWLNGYRKRVNPKKP